MSKEEKVEKNEVRIICPICNEQMEEYPYAYDNNQYGKKYVKCNYCGHKQLA